MDRKLGGSQSQSGRCGVEKNIFPLPGIEPRPFSPYLVAIPTDLSRFLAYISEGIGEKGEHRREQSQQYENREQKMKEQI
jgi:hypothetical protein